MSELVIREATPEDLPALRQLFLDSRQAAFLWLAPADFALADFDTATQGELVLVAQRADRLLGFVSCWLPDNFVHNLFLAPDARRSGLGTVLLKAALARLGRPARLKCQVQNTAALSFYRAGGWTEVASGMSPEGEYLVLQFDASRE